MNLPEFGARARRALHRPPGYLARRCVESIRSRADRPWSAVVPRLVSERAVLRANGAAGVDALWRQCSESPFFVKAADRDRWVPEFEAICPEAREEILAAADRALRREFNLLGSGPVALGRPLQWLADFKTHREWPPQFFRDIEYLELDRQSDVKVPWELSRCQHFVRLGQAFWLTGDERYAQEFVDQVREWVAGNPYAWTVNWACAMDVALRAVSWIWGFSLMSDAQACRTREFRALFLRALFLHGEFIATHLEKADLNGNHYLCDGVGLVFLGCFFRSSRKGQHWKAIGTEIVVSEIFTQVTPDGVDFEQSTAYHRLVTEGFSTAYLLLKRHGDPVPDEAWRRLERMHEFVAAYTKPDGRAPLIGDADDGRIQILGTQPIGDHRYLLSNGTAMFDRADFAASAGRFWDESFWMFGPEGRARFRAQPAVERCGHSAVFPDGGFFVLRSGTTHLIVDCGDVGMRGRGGHGHNDILSFELFLNGFNVVTDCGAYLYTASREWRNRFRSTAFHNIVQVDGEELNRFVGPDALWQLHDDATPLNATVESRDGVERFRGAHRGYERLADPVTHTRECCLDAHASRVLVRDVIAGTGEHELVWRFHLDPAVAAQLEDGDARLSSAGRDVWLLPDETPAAWKLTIEPGWVSPSYGVKVPTRVVVWQVAARLPVTASFVFSDSRLTRVARSAVRQRLSWDS